MTGTEATLLVLMFAFIGTTVGYRVLLLRAEEERDDLLMALGRMRDAQRRYEEAHRKAMTP